MAHTASGAVIEAVSRTRSPSTQRPTRSRFQSRPMTVEGPRDSWVAVGSLDEPFWSMNPSSPYAAGQTRGGAHSTNIDGMSYEQLLRAFGNGSDNIRPASRRAISSLPTSQVQETKSSTDNSCHARCSICLENFNKGDSRKTLPCLHGHHPNCIDTWLRQNGSCPICKHNVQQN